MTIVGKRVVVTGGFGALGRAVGGALSGAGAQVALLDVAAAPQGHGCALGLGGVDLADAKAASAAIATAVQALGGLDALVNIAGGFRWQMLGEGAVETFDLLYRLNVKTAACCCIAALPHLKPGGAIVTIGAGAAVKAGAGMGAYAASKAGVMRFTEALAEEQKGRLRVNCLLPSIIDTPANRKDMPDADFAKWVSTTELANVIGFLISDAASGITGALIAVPGRV